MKTPIPRGTEEIVLPPGFRAAGIAAGIKKPGVPDMALIVSDRPAAAAGVFTTNQVCAATVKLDRERLKGRAGRAIVVNSGNANACTGPAGVRDARRMAALAARHLGLGRSSSARPAASACRCRCRSSSAASPRSRRRSRRRAVRTRRGRS